MKNKKKNILILAVTAAMFFHLHVQTVQASLGDYDPSFGFLGAQLYSETDHYPSKVVLQPDGKILVTGYRLLSTGKKRMFLNRYLPSGQPDASFGSDGAAIVYGFVSKLDNDWGKDIAVLPNGKIAVAGTNKDNFPTVWQFNPEGRLDSAFGAGGKIVFSNSDYSHLVKISVQNTKFIVGLARYFTNPNTTRVVMHRLNADGTLDTRFGSSGEAVTGILGQGDFSIMVESETRKITVGGHNSINIYRIGLERLMSSGQKDNLCESIVEK